MDGREWREVKEDERGKESREESGGKRKSEEEGRHKKIEESKLQKICDILPLLLSRLNFFELLGR